MVSLCEQMLMNVLGKSALVRTLNVLILKEALAVSAVKDSLEMDTTVQVCQFV